MISFLSDQSAAEREDFVQQTTHILEHTPSRPDDDVDGKRRNPDLETACWRWVKWRHVALDML